MPCPSSCPTGLCDPPCLVLDGRKQLIAELLHLATHHLEWGPKNGLATGKSGAPRVPKPKAMCAETPRCGNLTQKKVRQVSHCHPVLSSFNTKAPQNKPKSVRQMPALVGRKPKSQPLRECSESLLRLRRCSENAPFFQQSET